jgi:hypothetical protein
LEGISHLSRLKLRIKQASTQSLIDKYLEEAAKAQGVTVSEIEDLAVDNYGLVDGKGIWQYDDYTFDLEIITPGKTQQRWLKPDGTPQKSEPATVKANHVAKLKKMKLWIKQVEQASTAQRDGPYVPGGSQNEVGLFPGLLFEPWTDGFPHEETHLGISFEGNQSGRNLERRRMGKCSRCCSRASSRMRSLTLAPRHCFSSRNQGLA